MLIPKVSRAFIFFMLLIVVSQTAFAGSDRRPLYMGTSNFALPTGFVRSEVCYINDNSHSAMLLSQSMFSEFMEVSMLRHLNGAEKNKNILNVKVKLLEEGTVIPSLVWGASDISTQLGSKIFYIAASKQVEAFGLQLHGGFYKDPETTDKKMFYGIEKMVFPLVTVSAERSDDVDTYGVKLTPYPGVSLEIAQRDQKEELYNINYFRSF